MTPLALLAAMCLVTLVAVGGWAGGLSSFSLTRNCGASFPSGMRPGGFGG